MKSGLCGLQLCIRSDTASYARCSCLKVSNNFFLLIIRYLLFFHQSWAFVLVPRLLSSAISSVQGLVVKFHFFLLINIKMISVIKRSFKVYQLIALTQKFDDISIPLGISRPSLVSLCPARRRLSGITESLKSNGNGKILFKFHTCGFFRMLVSNLKRQSEMEQALHYKLLKGPKSVI